jgi:hypothetical protein
MIFSITVQRPVSVVCWRWHSDFSHHTAALLTTTLNVKKNSRMIPNSIGAKLSVVFDAPDVWDPATEQCGQIRYEDYTGVDSLGAFFLSIIVFVTVQYMEHALGRPLFTFPGGTPYDKPFPDDKGDTEVVQEEGQTKEEDGTEKSKMEEAIIVVPDQQADNIHEPDEAFA